jgi:hypothetical protein
MSERFKFALSQAVGAGGLEKEAVMYYVIGGTGRRPGEPIHRNGSGSDPVHKNPLDVIERVRQRLPGKDAELS